MQKPEWSPENRKKLLIAQPLIGNAVAAIEKKLGTIPLPQIGLVLGSGLGDLAKAVESTGITIPFGEIPGFHSTHVVGHPGKLIIGKWKETSVAILQGRFHFYEGHRMEEIALPIRTLIGLGCEWLIQTNAAGGINTRFRAGDLMLIEDHINLMGDNPMKGPHQLAYGPRFPDLSECYSKLGLEIAVSAAQKCGVELKRGVYGGLLGPVYETPAEVRMLRTLGIDTVGMSTVPESIAARALQVPMIGLSLVSNLAAGMTSNSLTHEEVMETSQQAVSKLTRLLDQIMTDLPLKTSKERQGS